MKNLLAFLGVALIVIAAFAFSPRFGTTAKSDNTGRVITYSYTAPAYSAVALAKPNASVAYIDMGTLTGAQLDSVNISRAKVCDELTYMFKASGAARTVTFGSGFKPAGTLRVGQDSSAVATFIFNGSNYIEKSRAIQK